MVKNTTGGSKHKNVARKTVNGGRSSRLRMIQEEGELYAVVTKILGGSNCSVTGSDNVERLCVIRGKFRGGKRRDNMLRTGTLVLVGDREWETTGKKHTCDLLEVYADSDKDKLKTIVTTVNWSFLTGVGEIGSVRASATDDIEFCDNTVNEEYQELIEKETEGTGVSVIDFGHEEDVAIDDI